MGVILEQEEDRGAGHQDIINKAGYNLSPSCVISSTEKVPRFSVSLQSSNSSINQLSW